MQDNSNSGQTPKNQKGALVIIILLSVAVVMLAGALVLVLTKDDSEKETDKIEETTEKQKEHPDGVTITYPASFFEKTDAEEMEDSMKDDEEVLDISINDDGSVTMVVTPERYEKIKDAAESAMNYSISTMINEEEAIKGIDFNESYTVIDIVVEKDVVFASSAVDDVLYMVKLYHIVHQNDVVIEVNYIDEATNEVYLIEVHEVNISAQTLHGSKIVFEPDVENLDDVTYEQLEEVKRVIRARLDGLGLEEATIAFQGDKQICVTIPDVSDPNEVTAMIGQMAHLTFRDAFGNVVVDGSSDIEYAEASFNREMGVSSYYVTITLTAEGREKFKKATEDAVALSYQGLNIIGIYLDENLYSCPMVQEVIDSETCVINSILSQEEAENLANIINSGRLPFSLSVVELRSV